MGRLLLDKRFGMRHAALCRKAVSDNITWRVVGRQDEKTRLAAEEELAACSASGLGIETHSSRRRGF